MLYHLLLPLSENFILFNLFRYITFRTAGATVTALLISLILGPMVIRRLRDKQVAERIRDDGPASHKVKEGPRCFGPI
jgi:phospho-N-acetylmuramoyl-pentapeptide-transferase